jgi:D-alanyl-D-alanine carboxypeptidase/D-alanyl-D-alanine-endopeptidase (penicillin-binding protein 4)
MASASRISLSLSVLLLLAACSTTAPRPPANPAPDLTATIDRLVATPALEHAVWGVLVEDPAGNVLYSRNPHTLLQPASNRKLFAAATIANCLGFDAQLSTDIHRDGDDLVIRGNADPSLGSWRYGREDDFLHVADVLRERGITSVRDVIADVSLFDRVTIPPSWKYGNIGSDYAAPVDALTWGEGEIANDRAVPDAAQHTADALRIALVERGITVSGVARVNAAPRAWGERIASIPSPFVSHLMFAMMKNSHNLYAEMLLKRLAGTYEGAFAIERNFLTAEAGIAADEFRFVDGSGLSPDDHVTPASTIRILRWMNDPARRALWWTILATPNEEGTLRRRLVPLQHRLRGKTGTIAGVNALAGIIHAERGGGYRYFVVMINHHIADEANPTIDAIVNAIAAF